MKKLIAFDFDHTIIDKNSDVVAMEMLPKNGIPDSLRELYKEDGWTNFMQGVFKLLKEHNFTEKNIREVIEELKPTDGMCDLIRELSDKLNYDVIIISDSNSYFINVWLQKYCLEKHVLKVFTNPAQFEEDLLSIKMFHLQNTCTLSTKNLCKGQVLEDFITKQNKDNVNYERIVYVGDGTNDFCPILRLKDSDICCVRKNYKLAQIVQKTLEGKPFDESNIVYKLKSKVVMWDTGSEIFKAITEEM